MKIDADIRGDECAGISFEFEFDIFYLRVTGEDVDVRVALDDEQAKCMKAQLAGWYGSD